MFCKHCGKKIKDGASFCACCGTPVQAGNGTMQIQAVESNIESTIKKKKIVIISCIAVMLVLAAVGTGAALYFNSDEYQSRMTLAEEADKATVDADVSEIENGGEAVLSKEAAEDESDMLQQDEKKESDGEGGMSVFEEYSDVETNVWKTEEHYRHTQDGGEYLQSLIEYDSREHVEIGRASCRERV